SSSAEIFPLIQNALGDSDNSVRRAAVAALPILLEKGSSSAEIFPLIQNALGDSDWSVFTAAVAALQILLEKGGSSAEIFPLIQNVLAERNDYVHRAAVAALQTLIEKSDDLSYFFSHIKETLEYRRYNFSSYLRECFEKYATDAMIDYYWATKDESIMPFLIPRLYEVALTVEDIDLEQQRLTLYPRIDKSISWTKPKEEVSKFRELIRDTARFLKESI
ncbi:MAG: HEAT repeat domain-containing protein, partial [Bacteroidota bacterium]